MLTKENLIQALRAVTDVGETNDIVANSRIQNIEIDDGRVKLTLFLTTRDKAERLRIEDMCFDVLGKIPDVTDVQVVITGPEVVPGQQESKPGQTPSPAGKPGQPPPPAGKPGQTPPPAGKPVDDRAPIPGVKNIIAVASGKGGVGKSTICVNLALALQKGGASVGLLDADIYGPSLHILLGVTDRPMPGTTKEIVPVEQDGLKLMSLGFLTDMNLPVIWRGPMVAGVVKKFLQDVEWGELDYLMIDLPPGTGDAQLTLAQTVPLTGAIIVTTPSQIALVDAEKGLKMFEQVDAPVLGIVENMSTFICPHCGESTDIFDSGGGDKISKRTSVALLGKIPLDAKVRADGDKGIPIVKSDMDSPISKAFLEIADKILARHPAEIR